MRLHALLQRPVVPEMPEVPEVLEGDVRIGTAELGLAQHGVSKATVTAAVVVGSSPSAEASEVLPSEQVSSPVSSPVSSSLRGVTVSMIRHVHYLALVTFVYWHSGLLALHRWGCRLRCVRHSSADLQNFEKGWVSLPGQVLP